MRLVQGTVCNGIEMLHAFYRDQCQFGGLWIVPASMETEPVALFLAWTNALHWVKSEGGAKGSLTKYKRGE